MLVFHHSALHKIKIHAMQSYPEECCGFLLGKIRHGSKAICDGFPVANQDRNCTQHFFISPEVYRHAEQLALNEKVEIIGLYHSHPDLAAEPSSFDLAHALLNWSYLIVKAEEGIPADVTSWVLREDRSTFVEEEVQDWVDYDCLSTNYPVKKG